MFIEGVTKDKSANIRAECATGLGKVGVQSLRILLITLNDDSPIVREAASAAILKNMTTEDIKQEFSKKQY